MLTSDPRLKTMVGGGPCFRFVRAGAATVTAGSGLTLAFFVYRRGLHVSVAASGC